MYRLGIEGILGVQRAGDALEIDPRVRSDWRSFQVVYRFGDARYRIRVENPDAVEQGVQRVVLDGNDLPDRTVPLDDDGQDHDVRVVMG
jgi:cyclic beta-1,2-glucan synthetase